MSFLTQRETLLKVSIAVFPVIYLSIVVLFFVDIELYIRTSLEDGPAEYMTALFLLLTSIVGLITLISIRKSQGYFHWYFAAVAVLFFFAVLEEISFGQRIFGIATPEYFLERNDQLELNLHNTVQGYWREFFDEYRMHYFKTRTVAQFVAIIYGVYLPILFHVGIGRTLVEKFRLVIPPLELVPGFVLAAIFLSDQPTGQEEEYGELLLSLCFLILMWSERLLHRRKS